MSWLEHFRQEERPFIERVLDWLELVEVQHSKKLTDFLDPRQVSIVNTLVGKFNHVKLSFSGGFTGAERCRVLLHQEYHIPTEDELGIAAFKVKSHQPAFQKLKHKDYLGALIGTGLKRDKFGDIHLHSDGVQLAVAGEVADYLRLHLTQVHHVSVTLDPIDISDLTPVMQDWKTMNITVPSSRADVVVGEVFRLSRSKALIPIRAGHLKINWMVVDSPSFSIKEGDVVSLRGFGRCKILQDEGTTKKGNIRLEVGVLL